METALIVQARMTSTRLPGKVLKEVLGRPLLDYQVERLRRVRLQDGLIIATTVNTTDEPLVAFCEERKIPYYRGSEDDVLARYLEAAETFDVANIVRITSDCPLIDPEIVDRVIGTFFNNRENTDYVANTLERTFPRGLDCEIFSSDLLREIDKLATDSSEREHVTSYIYKHLEKYRLMNVAGEEDLSRYRWTVDTAEDFELIRRILTELYPVKPEFSTRDCLELLERHPDWNDINRHVRQKAG
jgi:spore coat polysaccharide biosynthesis protein SpsF